MIVSHLEPSEEAGWCKTREAGCDILVLLQFLSCSSNRCYIVARMNNQRAVNFVEQQTFIEEHQFLIQWI